MKSITILIASILFSNLLHAAPFTEFCSEIKTWKKGANTKTEIGYQKYLDAKIATPREAPFAITKLKEKGWLVIDARDNGARKSTGLISNTLLITADYNKATKDEFKRETILKKFNSKKFKRHLKKRKIASVSSTEDLSKMNFILFCNGFKCHRSSHGACQLRSYGVPFENIHLILGGFDAMKDAGAKVK